MIIVSKVWRYGIAFAVTLAAFGALVQQNSRDDADCDQPGADPASCDKPSDGEEAPLKLETITVFGEKKPLNLQESLSSIGVVGAEEINETGVLDFQEAFRLLANVRDGAGNNNGFVIRGINSEGIGINAGGTPLASLYIDGVVQTPFGTRRGARGLWDVQQVEVLRGSQSTVTGRNALAGAISIKSNDPTFYWEGAARLSGDDREFAEAAATISGPIIRDKLAFRLAHQQFEDNTNIDFIALDLDRDPAEGEYRNTRLKLRLEPLYEVPLAINYTVSHAVDQPGDAAANTNQGNFSLFDRVNTNAFEFRETTVTNQALEVTYDLNRALRLSSITTTADDETNRSFFRIEQGQTVQRLGGSVDFDNFTQELRLNYAPVDSRTTAVLGLYYFEESLLNNTVALTSVPTRFGADITEQNYALFGQIDWSIAENVSVQFGGRWDRADFEGRLFNGPVDNPLVTERPDADYTEFLPSLGLLIDATDNVSFGLLFKKGFRAGGSDVNSEGPFEFGPEQTWTYEATLRSQWLDERLRLNANLFFTNWEDQQVSFPISPNAGDELTANLGDSDLAGLEIEFDLALSRKLVLKGSIGFVETRVVTAVSTISTVGNAAGDAFREAAPFSAAASFVYGGRTGWFLSGDAEYTDGYESQLPNVQNTAVPGFLVANLRGGYRFTRDAYRGRIALQIDNVLDNRFLLNIDQFGAANLWRQRTTGLTFSVNW
ncbi:MAG: TonB-dependent receptor [Pseudomonadota bacterium]